METAEKEMHIGCEETKYKESQFNVFGKFSKKWILANTLTGAILRLNTEGMNASKYLLQNPSIIHRFNNTELCRMLVQNGFLILQDYSELEFLQRTNSLARRGEDSLGLAITTTLQCNFRCVYCYESETLGPSHLSERLQSSALRLLEKELPRKRVLHIVWWGGEPLLRPRTIDNLSTRMIECCMRNNVRYLGSIVTNGSLLDTKNAKMLHEHHVKRVQITIDGDRDSHDSRRIGISGEATFDKILENLRENAHYFSHIILRINVDRRNYRQAIKLLDDLDVLKDRVFLAPRPANDPHTKTRPDWLLTLKEFVNFEDEFNNFAYKNGFRVVVGHCDPGTTYCNAYQSRNSFCIDPHGGVHICPIFTGDQVECFGQITEQGDIVKAPENENRESRLARTEYPFSDADCVSCKALPICMGGCPLYDGASPPGLDDLRCIARHNIAEKMYLARFWKFGTDDANEVC